MQGVILLVVARLLMCWVGVLERCVVVASGRHGWGASIGRAAFYGVKSMESCCVQNSKFEEACKDLDLNSLHTSHCLH
jgi:hypothetical protein